MDKYNEMKEKVMKRIREKGVIMDECKYDLMIKILKRKKIPPSQAAKLSLYASTGLLHEDIIKIVEEAENEVGGNE